MTGIRMFKRKLFTVIVLLSAIVAVVTAMLFPVAPVETLPDAHSNPLLGMWQQCSCSTKSEIIFNEDFTGFVFDCDTLFCEIQWRYDELLAVDFSLITDASRITAKVLYNVDFINDTLLLKNVDNGELLKFNRVK